MQAQLQPSDDHAYQLVRLHADAAKAQDFARRARAENTKRAYRADWFDFVTWCELRGLTPLPATPETVAVYVSSRATPTDDAPALSLATLRRRLSAISQAHRAAGHATPAKTSDEPLHSVWSGIARTKTRRKKKAAPVLIEDLRAILAALPMDDGELTLAARRDRALLLVGWAGALRRSEVAALTVDDVQIGPDGLVLRIARGKTDQEGEGLVKGIPHGEHPATCPIRALQAWLRVAGIEDGPLFRSIDRHGNVGRRALSTDGVHRIIKRACGRVGLDTALYSGHSLRAGFITQAARAGKPERIIMRHSGHKDLKTLREYIREGGLFQENAVSGIGL